MNLKPEFHFQIHLFIKWVNFFYNQIHLIRIESNKINKSWPKLLPLIKIKKP